MITGTQVRMARAALKWGVRDLADAAEVSPATVTRIEGGHPANSATLTVIRTALEKAGVQFTPADNGGEGVRLRHGPGAGEAA